MDATQSILPHEQARFGSMAAEWWDPHGSSAMRHQWLKKGFDTGDPNQCNTFAAGALN